MFLALRNARRAFAGGHRARFVSTAPLVYVRSSVKRSSEVESLVKEIMSVAPATAVDAAVKPADCDTNADHRRHNLQILRGADVFVGVLEERMGKEVGGESINRSPAWTSTIDLGYFARMTEEKVARGDVAADEINLMLVLRAEEIHQVTAAVLQLPNTLYFMVVDELPMSPFFYEETVSSFPNLLVVSKDDVTELKQEVTSVISRFAERRGGPP